MFTSDTFTFLSQLRRNNNRPWFLRNKGRHEEKVLGPALQFVEEVGPKLKRLSIQIEAEPKKSGGSVMRIYRDTRFSKDKSPYKTNLGIYFRHRRGRGVHAPGLYLHIDPRECFLGAGIWHPESDVLGKIRTRIVKNAAEWRKVKGDRKLWRTWKELVGDALQRPPRGFDEGHPFIEDLKRKDYIVTARLRRGDVLKKDFADRCARDWLASRPLMEFLCRAQGLAF